MAERRAAPLEVRRLRATHWWSWYCRPCTAAGNAYRTHGDALESALAHHHTCWHARIESGMNATRRLCFPTREPR